jgi:hypothetical protein
MYQSLPIMYQKLCKVAVKQLLSMRLPTDECFYDYYIHDQLIVSSLQKEITRAGVSRDF